MGLPEKDQDGWTNERPEWKNGGQPRRVVVSGYAHGGCRLRHATAVRDDFACDPDSTYLLESSVRERFARVREKVEDMLHRNEGMPTMDFVGYADEQRGRCAALRDVLAILDECEPKEGE